MTGFHHSELVQDFVLTDFNTDIKSDTMLAKMPSGSNIYALFAKNKHKLQPTQVGPHAQLGQSMLLENFFTICHVACRSASTFRLIPRLSQWQATMSILLHRQAQLISCQQLCC